MFSKTFFPACRLHADLPLKVFGCIVFMLTPNSRSKLDPRVEKCIFIGYSTNQKGYRCYNPTTKKLHVSMDVTFLEQQPFYKKNSLQGESVSEDNFLNEPLPTPILCIENTNLNNHTTELIEQHVETSPDYEIDKGNLVPDLGGSQTREEIPQSNQELRVYARKFPQRNKKQSIISASSQPETPDDGPTEIPQEQTDNSKNSTDNVDLPIALRKKNQNLHKKVTQS
jgi:hypothetical protein